MKRSGLVAIAIAIAAPLAAQTGLDFRDLDEYLENAVASSSIPGVVAVVVDANGVRYQAAFGYRDVADAAPMTTDAIFNIASMTKPVTSVAATMLVERGTIDLDDPVARYVPDLAGREVIRDHDAATGTYTTRPARAEMTLRHLLTNTSGLGYNFCSDVLAAINPERARAIELPLLHDPGVRWTYGESTRVVGTIVEVVSGQTLDAYLDEHVFSPLGMNDTAWTVPSAKTHRVVTRYRKTPAGMEPIPNDGPVGGAPRGDGGLYSTASDYARFIQMFLNEGRGPGGARLLAASSVASMGQNHIGDVRVSLQPTTDPGTSLPFPLGAGEDTFGLGFQIEAPHDEALMRSPGSLSWAGLYNTQFWIDPARGIGAVLLMQYLPFYDDAAIEVLQGFEERVYRALRRDKGSVTLEPRQEVAAELARRREERVLGAVGLRAQ